MTLRFTVNHQGLGHEPPVVSLSIHKSGNLSSVVGPSIPPPEGLGGIDLSNLSLSLLE